MDLLAAYDRCRAADGRLAAGLAALLAGCSSQSPEHIGLLPDCSGEEGSPSSPVKLLDISVSAAPDVEVAGLQLVKGQAVPVGQALHLQRASLPPPRPPPPAGPLLLLLAALMLMACSCCSGLNNMCIIGSRRRVPSLFLAPRCRLYSSPQPTLATLPACLPRSTPPCYLQRRRCAK